MENPLLTFLDRIEKMPDTAPRRLRSYELAGLKPGHRALDIGCGAGTAVREMAAVAGSSGSAIGIDMNEALIGIAKERAASFNVNTQFQAASADSLPFGDESFDTLRAERVFQHLPDPSAAVAEAYRVLKPGGAIVLIDQDWDLVTFDADDKEATRAVVRAFGDGVAHSRGARSYRRLFIESGFTRVRVAADTVISTSYDDHGYFAELMATTTEMRGAVPSATAQSWLADQKTRAERGTFLMAMTHLLTVAYRPE